MKIVYASPATAHKARNFPPNSPSTITGYATEYNETDLHNLHAVANAPQTSCQNPLIHEHHKRLDEQVCGFPPGSGR